MNDNIMWYGCGVLAGWLVVDVVRCLMRRGGKDTTERFDVRYERSGDDPITMQWLHRTHEMNARQAKLDASQNVLVRLL